MAKLFIKDLPLKDKKVLMRADFNVPLSKEHTVTDLTKIEETLPSIRYVLDQGGSLILMSHLGRPKNVFEPALSLAPIAKILSEKLQRRVILTPNCVGPGVEELTSALQPGGVLLLENLRFHWAEEHPDECPGFAKELASYGDFYINDAFGTSHRKHTSTYAVPLLFPAKAAAGFLLEKEIRFLGEALNAPKHPFYALIGGAKVSTKIGVIKSLLKKVDRLLIGGGMAYTFLKAEGIEIGNSLFEEDCLLLAKEILQGYRQKILLPLDSVSANEEGAVKIFDFKKGIPNGYQGLDIGPATIECFSQALQEAQTVLWNGPFGVYEQERFAKGTIALAQTIGQLKATTIAGGGDLIAALKKAGVASRFTHLSTGGGATLEYIELGTLPGIEVLSDKS